MNSIPTNSSLTYERLIQLKNGQWIDPAEISGVIAIRERDGRGAVLINTYAGWHVRVSVFADFDEAAAYRDFIARKANTSSSRPANGKLSMPMALAIVNPINGAAAAE